MVFNYATGNSTNVSVAKVAKRPATASSEWLTGYCKYNHYHFSCYSVEFEIKTLVYVMFASDRERN